jgi:hypothetical protein
MSGGTTANRAAIDYPIERCMNIYYRIILLLVLFTCLGALCSADSTLAQDDPPEVLPVTGAPTPANANDYVTNLDTLRAGSQPKVKHDSGLVNPAALDTDRIMREYTAAARAGAGTANDYITTLDLLRVLGMR